MNSNAFSLNDFCTASSDHGYPDIERPHREALLSPSGHQEHYPPCHGKSPRREMVPDVWLWCNQRSLDFQQERQQNACDGESDSVKTGKTSGSENETTTTAAAAPRTTDSELMQFNDNQQKRNTHRRSWRSAGHNKRASASNQNRKTFNTRNRDNGNQSKQHQAVVRTDEIALFMRYKKPGDFKPIPPAPGGWDEVKPERVIEWDQTAECLSDYSCYINAQKQDEDAWKKDVPWVQDFEETSDDSTTTTTTTLSTAKAQDDSTAKKTTTQRTAPLSASPPPPPTLISSFNHHNPAPPPRYRPFYSERDFNAHLFPNDDEREIPEHYPLPIIEQQFRQPLPGNQYASRMTQSSNPYNDARELTDTPRPKTLCPPLDATPIRSSQPWTMEAALPSLWSPILQQRRGSFTQFPTEFRRWNYADGGNMLHGLEERFASIMRVVDEEEVSFLSSKRHTCHNDTYGAKGSWRTTTSSMDGMEVLIANSQLLQNMVQNGNIGCRYCGAGTHWVARDCPFIPLLHPQDAWIQLIHASRQRQKTAAAAAAAAAAFMDALAVYSKSQPSDTLQSIARKLAASSSSTAVGGLQLVAIDQEIPNTTILVDLQGRHRRRYTAVALNADQMYCCPGVPLTAEQNYERLADAGLPRDLTEVALCRVCSQRGHWAKDCSLQTTTNITDSSSSSRRLYHSLNDYVLVDGI